jgi:pyrroline-5-carboxylate reductase
MTPTRTPTSDPKTAAERPAFDIRTLGRIGAIGAGNMATALLRGLRAAGVPSDALLASDPSPERRAAAEAALGIRTTDSNQAVAAESDIVILAVKPSQLEAATAGLRERTGAHAGAEGPLYVSILAGCRLTRLTACVGPRVVRVMPNTPALIGAGISAISAPPELPASDVDRAEAVLAAVGEVVRVPESSLDAVTGLSGSGPAYVLLLIEALSDAGVREGLPVDVARRLAAATTAGAARMLIETGVHPATLREQVTSPGGTTAAGVAALEEHGLRRAVLACVRAATQRSAELS